MKLIAEITDKEILGTDGLSSAKPRYTARAIVKNGDLYAVICSEKFHPYSLPGGGIDGGEDIITALKREILEETGCTCKKIKELGMVKENRASADYTQCSYYYVVEAGSVGTPQFTEEETNSGTALQWHTLPEMIKLINELEPKTYQQQYLKARDVAALEEYIMTEYVIKKVTEENKEIGDFINEGFSKYGEQNKIILNYDEFCFVAENEGGIIGAITGRAYYNEVHIGDLIVDEKYRKSGLGSKLVKTVEDTYKGKEYDIITLTTFGFQAPEFYKKLGYKVDFVRNNCDSRLSKYFLSKAL